MFLTQNLFETSLYFINNITKIYKIFFFKSLFYSIMIYTMHSTLLVMLVI